MSGWTGGRGRSSSPWLPAARHTLPVGGALLRCCAAPPAAGRGRPPMVRAELHQTAAAQAGVRRRFAPHQLRHAHAVEMSREGVLAARDPAPARARRPRDHLGVPTWDRQHRDRPRRPRAPGANDPSRPAGCRNLAVRPGAPCLVPTCPADPSSPARSRPRKVADAIARNDVAEPRKRSRGWQHPGR